MVYWSDFFFFLDFALTFILSWFLLGFLDEHFVINKFILQKISKLILCRFIILEIDMVLSLHSSERETVHVILHYFCFIDCFRREEMLRNSVCHFQSNVSQQKESGIIFFCVAKLSRLNLCGLGCWEPEFFRSFIFKKLDVEHYRVSDIMSNIIHSNRLVNSSL